MTRAKRPPGWCWRIDGEPVEYGIHGHFDDDAAIEIARAYEGGEIVSATVTRDYQRTVPCRRNPCDADECGGSHLERADGPGCGASAYTWVEVAS